MIAYHRHHLGCYSHSSDTFDMIYHSMSGYGKGAEHAVTDHTQIPNVSRDMARSKMNLDCNTGTPGIITR